MRIVEIKNEDIDYNIYIGKDAFVNIFKYIDLKNPILVVTDDTVMNLHLSTLLMEIDSDNLYVFSVGENAENSKVISSYERLIEYALKHQFDKTLQVLAFGGGAVGDFAGYFAATYKRGVRFINIPTTLLAHDSAVGGKVALNVKDIKNMIGTFYQPIAVIYHTPFLKTLNKREVLSGFGEIIKHDLLSDLYLLNNVLFQFQDLTEILDHSDVLEDILEKAILVKREYILEDIYDQKGMRQYLNLGHTLGHAIEILYDYSHGEAISLGICFDLFLSKNKDYKNMYLLYKKYGYFEREVEFDVDAIGSLMKHDKKNVNQNLKFIGLKSYGKPYEIVISEKDFIKDFSKFLSKIKK